MEKAASAAFFYDYGLKKKSKIIRLSFSKVQSFIFQNLLFSSSKLLKEDYISASKACIKQVFAGALLGLGYLTLMEFNRDKR
ncbi:MAG: hypothetical protein COV52_02835 [Gammaproteobacteria bacterium CG11_big_fil_rev_8_21_14_0_20_46_22]|nr:MAG: hypothetical protein COW05_02225 [Gammaproteobacteria bacterium CG12_big_fil_rev_8_21_14_0_65_46_12]PIR11712.1 MAG: hypothetical protein COV52_02835 [Gammaproteobacteria bacterium CG11_big_fil_rev_8_21_14_0_20_46_22]